MANTILNKRSSTASSVPSAGSLGAGEIAINTTDEKIYFKNTGGSVIDFGSDKLKATNGISTGQYESIVAVPALVIDVSNGNVQTKSVSANTTFTFTGWTANASSVVLELTASSSPTVTFSGATFKDAPTIQDGLNVFVFTSTDNGTTINGFIARDGA